jgi:DNA-binding LacI/PurR family transcriptional regulator
VNIRDLARHLNISIGTVSRALNGRKDVNPETRRRVIEAAAKLNYAPNQSGRSLRRGTTHAVAFLLQPHPGDNQYGEPFFVPLLKGVQSRLATHGLELIAVVDEQGDNHERLRRIVEARWADAVLLAWTRHVDHRIEYLARAGFPFATLGRSRSGGNGYPTLDLDFVRAAQDAVDRLVKFGHRRIGIVSPSPDLNFVHLFRRGFRAALKRHGLPFEEDLIAAGEVNQDGGYAATRRIMARSDRPHALIFHNDVMALGGNRALSDLGLKAGRDVAVLVVVASPLVEYLTPTLTGFSVDLEPLGRRLADILLASMARHGGPDGPRIVHEVWPLALTPRESDVLPANAPAAAGSPRPRLAL